MDKVHLGLNVDIKRTDRRIHPAKISCVNAHNRTVTVEWIENGETKAKEIEIESIFALNPQLLLSHHQSISEATPASARIITPKKSRRVTSGHCRVEHAQLPVSSHGLHSNIRDTPLGTIKSSPKLSKEDRFHSTPGISNNRAAVVRSGTRLSAESLAGRRRTNPVKEVERLEKNREQRRARIAETREEKRSKMRKDPGNLNWEFSAMIKEFCASLDYHPIRDTDFLDPNSFNPQISVCVRKRPMNKKEIETKEIDIVSIPDRQKLFVHEPKLKVDLTKYLENQQFRFDFAFDENCNNEVVYRCTARPLVKTIFEGGMATCFAYGQTGSGKTHTMGGEFQGRNQNCGNGIYVLTATDVFKTIQQAKYRDLVVSASFFEIYSGNVFDLLNSKSKLRVLEDGKQQVQVVGLSERPVSSVDDVLDLIRLGSRARTSGQTAANANSSRSHAVFQIVLRNSTNSRLHGKFSLVDLAGNERGTDNNSADRQTRMEGSEINKSLLALKECIRALSRKGSHLPFRASKLTQVLKDSFVGDKSRTCMIAMISPGMSSCEHSLNTLRYADRVKELVVDPAESVQENLKEIKTELMDDELNLQLITEEEEAEELSAELYSFHEAAFRLQEMEEEVVDGHKTLLDGLPMWQKKLTNLLETTDRIDFNLEVYIQRMSSVLTEFSDDVLNLKTKFFNARRELQPENEEQVEENNHRPKIHKNYPRSLVFTGKKQVERSE